MTFWTPIRIAAIVTMGMAVIWLAIETLLRGEAQSLQWYPECTIPLAIAGWGVGFAIRPRVSWQGEANVAAELISFATLSLSAPPAAMLVVYLLSSVVSVIVCLLAWILWGILVTLSTVACGATWVALLCLILSFPALYFMDGERDSVAAVLGGSALALFSLVALQMWIGGLTVGEVFFGALVSKVVHSQSWIPEWGFVLTALRRSLSTYNHTRATGWFGSIVAGILAALCVSLLVRALRQKMMRIVWIRLYLPLAAAPLPDRIPILPPNTLWVTLSLTLIASLAFVLVVVGR